MQLAHGPDPHDITGEKMAAKAWNAIFRHFNANHGKKDAGYRQAMTTDAHTHATMHAPSSRGLRNWAVTSCDWPITPPHNEEMMREAERYPGKVILYWRGQTFSLRGRKRTRLDAYTQ